MDSNRVFILYMLTQVNKELTQGNFQRAVECAAIAAADATQFLETADMHFKQTLVSLERSYKLAKKSAQFPKDQDKAFQEVLVRLAKGVLRPDDKVQEGIPESQFEEFRAIDQQDMEVWNEGWKPESLCFRYLNILQMYKTKMEVSLPAQSPT